MKLTKIPKPPRAPGFNQVRETPEVIQALAEEAQGAGITSTEALRQIISAYLTRPFAFTQDKTPGRKTALWSNVKTDKTTIDNFTRHAKAHGVSVPEGIRQCVRHYLNKQGRPGTAENPNGYGQYGSQLE